MLPTLLLALTAAPPAVTATKSDTAVTFKAGDRVITHYTYAGTVETEKGGATKPLAKPFFYPLTTPAGVGVTRDWPMNRSTPGQEKDHFWQKSAWFCHGDVIPEGIPLPPKGKNDHVTGVDFWAETAGHGRIVCTKCEVEGSAIKTENAWQTADGVTIMTELRAITVAPVEKGYLITVDIMLRASVCPIAFGDTKEGCFGVRVQDGFALKTKNSDGVITSANGRTFKAPAKDDLSIWGQPSAWHDYSGTVNGKPVGIAIFDGARNPHPAYWHTRAYGLMAANPFARAGSKFPGQKGKTELVKLKKGETLALRYGLYVHDGGAESVPAAFAAFNDK